ncbi:MAG TPA: hypothetical protein VNL96_10350 [Gemmatimonadaceae bacterium]|jgi:hypothetical protein|nr:hypothetical protein [Gemmatimonadaceae bacterium]
MRRMILIAMVALASLLGSCDPLAPGGSGVELYLELDKTTLPVGETMTILARARNVGVKTITLAGPRDCLIYFEVFASGGAKVYTSDVCSGPMVTEELQPDEEKPQVFVWDGSSNSGIRLGTGIYMLRAVVRVQNDPYAGPGVNIRIE